MNFLTESTTFNERDGSWTATVTLVANTSPTGHELDKPRITLTLPIGPAGRRTALSDIHKQLADTARRSVNGTEVAKFLERVR